MRFIAIFIYASDEFCDFAALITASYRLSLYALMLFRPFFAAASSPPATAGRAAADARSRFDNVELPARLYIVISYFTTAVADDIRPGRTV